MMAATRAQRRIRRRRRQRLRGLPVVLGTLLGLVGGLLVAGAYPPPNTDVIQLQAAQWYQQMRHLVVPGRQSSASPWSSEPQIYAPPPIMEPPAADTADKLIDAKVAELINVNAPLPEAAQLAGKLDETLADLTLTHRMVVVDAATGETLYDRGGNAPVVPASTVKLFTGVAALDQLDWQHRFTTSATYTAERGVTLVGGGDGLLALGEGTGTTVGYAGLADLAADTWRHIREDLPLGITDINVTVDVSRYDRPWIHPDWNEGLMAAGWVSPVYPLNTYGGVTGPPEMAHTVVEDGAAYAAQTFAQHLSEQAAAEQSPVQFSYAGQAVAPQDSEPVATIRSATLGQQLTYAMKQSNNMLFEMFGREAALAAEQTPDFTGSTATTRATLETLGMTTDGLQFVDNSGLSPRSTATLHGTVDVMQLMLAEAQFRPLFDTLTVAGFDGTMRHRMAEAPYAGIVRSKTGTLEVASSNAGLTVTVDGRALFFAVNTTGADGDYAAARAEQDLLAEVLTDCGCTAP